MKKRLVVWSGVLVLLGVVVWGAFLLALGAGFKQTAQRDKTTLGITVAGINGTLGRYQSLPQLIADNRRVQEILAPTGSAPAPVAATTRVNRELKRINAVVLASDTYVMNTTGLTLAASNFDTATSFVGKNFNYRPYFQDAIAGKLGRFFALGTTSLKRGYYFSSPVRVRSKIVGVIAVKVNIDEMEAAWQSRDHEIIVTDENGIIFMSSKPDWLFKSIKPLSPTVLNSLKITRRYDQSRLSELPMKKLITSAQNYQLATVGKAESSVEYLIQSQPMSAQAWNVQIFSSTAPARIQAYIIAAVVLFVLLSVMLATAFFFQRRARLLERMNAQHKARQELEKQVSVRTFDLNAANQLLIEEVAERKAAESELRKTQGDLVQAGKLAALGQMSAALSHELNQPLAAVKSYADNAISYMDRDNFAQAGDNIFRISSLVDRMASISKHLRNFARKPNEKLSKVLIVNVIGDALELLDRRIKDVSADVSVDLCDDTIMIIGGQVRLQQVLVNLVSNALDCMQDLERPKVEIKVMRSGGRVIITVRDFGPGIADEVAGKIFDPFFTTKQVGKGLGLGLAISYNIIKDFDGQMSAKNHHEKGAVFSVDLVEASDAQEGVDLFKGDHPTSKDMA